MSQTILNRDVILLINDKLNINDQCTLRHVTKAMREILPVPRIVNIPFYQKFVSKIQQHHSNELPLRVVLGNQKFKYNDFLTIRPFVLDCYFVNQNVYNTNDGINGWQFEVTKRSVVENLYKLLLFESEEPNLIC